MRTILLLNIFNKTIIFKFSLLNKFPALPFVKPHRYIQQEKKRTNTVTKFKAEFQDLKYNKMCWGAI